MEDPTANEYFGNSANPTATLEVNSWGAVGATGGSSGLRFTELNTSSPVLSPNPGLGVLAVNDNGDVIYVEAPVGSTGPTGATGVTGAVGATGAQGATGVSIGNYCTNASNPLTGNFEVPLNDHNYYFTGQGTSPNSNFIGSSVGIGLNCGDPIPYAKLHVLQSVFNPNYSNGSAAGFFENNASGDIALGVFGQVYGDAQNNIGALVEAYGDNINASQNAFGAWGIATNALYKNIGVVGEGYKGDFNYGVYGVADTGSVNYAIYGYAPSSTLGLHYAGFFDGDVQFLGDVIGSQHGWTSSDSSFKNDIRPITNSTAIISRLRPKTYFLDTTDRYGMHFSNKRQYGFLSQEVEQVLPELVKVIHKPATRDLRGNILHPAIDYKAMNYGGLFGIIVAAMQEQQNQIQSRDSVINTLKANDSILTSRLELIEKCINALNLCDNSQSMYKQISSPTSVTEVRLKDVQTIILNQNVPNPFAEQTLISYFLPDAIKTAEIIFHNLDGKQISRVEITERGKGEINVYADDLSSGIYTYTLVADGKIVDTKRMVKR